MALSVVFADGFLANGVACGIKGSGALDLALVMSKGGKPIPCFATFTQNKAAAAPVVLSKEHLLKSNNRAAAWLLSSGNANAATGSRGLQDAQAMCAAIADELSIATHEVGVCSTGLIGIYMPIERPLAKISSLVHGASGDEAHGVLAAEAIMTTDTFAKFATYEGNGYRIGGMAKGAAMISPNMATMLAVITTDAIVDDGRLSRALTQAVSLTFNRLTIDGCTSTNDTVALMSSSLYPADEHFEEALLQVCKSLADQIAFDAEGATKMVRIEVEGAISVEEALVGARKIAESQLVKCSLYGKDPYWGRVASELGSSGIDFDLGKLSISYQGIEVAREGIGFDYDRSHLERLLEEREIKVSVNLGMGEASAVITTTDLGPGYIDENMGTS